MAEACALPGLDNPLLQTTDHTPRNPRKPQRTNPHTHNSHKHPPPLQDGLAAQLLGVVVAHERPDLEAARVELIAAMGADKALLSRLEDTLLRELSSATGARASPLCRDAAPRCPKHRTTSAHMGRCHC